MRLPGTGAFETVPEGGGSNGFAAEREAAGRLAGTRAFETMSAGGGLRRESETG
jgi:hypothetical protein